MAKKSLLLVDADPRSLRVLEVSLRKAGYSVATCRDGQSAVETVELSQPDLILSDTRLPGMNGFQLVEELRKKQELESVPFMFLSSDSSVESKVRGLELGVEDYLTKPIYIKEIITRINLTLQRQEREGLARRSTSVAKTRFTGSLGDMGLVDLLQTIDISRKSGVLELTNGAQAGSISFRDGQLVDAELGRLGAEQAIYRLLLWNEGEFEIDFRPVRVEQRIRASTQALLMEGMRRIDEWGRLLEQIPSLDNVFEVSEEELVDRLAEIPDEINAILKHIDGRRSLIQVVDAAEGDDLETLTAITKLYFEGIVYPTGRTNDGSDLLGEDRLDEELVPGEAEPSPRSESGDDLVPRPPTEPPPAADAPIQPPRGDAAPRAIRNGDGTDSGTAVPPSAEDVADDALGIQDDPEPDATGMGAALGLDERQRRDEGHVSPASTGALAKAAATADDSPSRNSSEDGYQMARKGRSRRKRREIASQEMQQVEQSQEATTNVIQFPAHAKHGIASAQVAVNDVQGSVEHTVDDAVARAKDDTRTVKRGDDDADDAAKVAAPRPRADSPDEPTVPEVDVAAMKAAEAEAREAQAREDAEREAREAQAREDTEREAREAQAREDAEREAREAQAREDAEREAQEAQAREDAEREAQEAQAREDAKREAQAREAAEREAQAAAAREAEAAEREAQASESSASDAADDRRGKKRGKKKRSKKARSQPSTPPSAATSDATASSEPSAGPSERELPAEASVIVAATPTVVEPEPTSPDMPLPAAPPSADERRKKHTTTTSAEIRAVSITGEHAAVAEDFFRSSSKPPAHETWDDLEREAITISPGAKKAKYATFGILALGALGFGWFMVYHNVVMPGEAELSHGAPPELPEGFAEPATATTPAPAEDPTPAAEPTEAEPTEPAEPAEAVAAVEGEPTEAEVAAEGEPTEAVAAEGEPTEAASGAVTVEAEDLMRNVEGIEAPEAPAPEAPEAPPGVEPRRLAQQAFTALNRRRNEEAAQLAQQAVAGDPTIALGWLVLGAARQELRDVPGARAAYQSCVEQGQGREVRDCRAMLR